MDNTPNTVAYEVSYRVWEGPDLNPTTAGPVRVIIGATSNHITTFGDIPKIIAVSRGIKAEDVLVLNADCVGIVDSRGHRV